MVRIYLDLETYRPNKESAFVDERIISAGLLLDETPHHESHLSEVPSQVLLSEWNGFDERQITKQLQGHIRDAIVNHKFTEIIGFGILRFDIPLLTARSVEYSLSTHNEALKMWHDCLAIDYVQQLLAANGNSYKGATLGNIITVARSLNLNPPPHSSTGEGIRELYPQRKYNEIEDHLKEDLNAIRWLDLYGARRLIEISLKRRRPLFHD
jgi:hypothetical protein